MTNTKQKKSDDLKNVSNTVVAAVTGAVVGASVVAAGVVAMRNNKNQEKVKEIVDDVKAKASTYMKTANDQVADSKSKLEQTADAAKKSNKEVKKIWKK
ncbi:MAG: hypothetical protein GW762_01850 [Candidatus Pacebacteria bacterium]|nr:hypothetical protein [Candidatus Paceibacterota bacterium]PIR63428.1 MAG: hypothetical protein COU64_04490 [Candidatus Pacebacteria bacterium CG10_big_fil_rev_8_21_14_0_10_40_26]PIZ79565.1 MAG: hypothetical protein COY01_00390 [Candidatus Pacebacteria bacterium CG_4_10_14_0_2_um_filter_40_20]PJA69018.1 MAG: hypothetical protein CO156_01640 [Candidatus Pacebacteria bacterium CG_4_9_14_3_um_filter_40_12]PJC41849.1 MAG: hypothetical protein CO041_03965 [Candidatus Pacebacteria bacterium CG_4_9_